MGWERVSLCILAKIKKENQQSKLQKCIIFCTLTVVIPCLSEILTRRSNFDVLYGSLKHNSTASVNSCTVAQSKLNIFVKTQSSPVFLQGTLFYIRQDIEPVE